MMRSPLAEVKESSLVISFGQDLRQLNLIWVSKGDSLTSKFRRKFEVHSVTQSISLRNLICVTFRRLGSLYCKSVSHSGGDFSPWLRGCFSSRHKIVSLLPNAELHYLYYRPTRSSLYLFPPQCRRLKNDTYTHPPRSLKALICSTESSRVMTGRLVTICIPSKNIYDPISDKSPPPRTQRCIYG